MPALQTNQNRVIAAVRDANAMAAQALAVALLHREIDWPVSARKALEIENAAPLVIDMLANIGWRLSQGDQVPPDWLRSLRQRVSRYHNIKV
jgi:hypothetical protein